MATTVALPHFPNQVLWEAKLKWEPTSQLIGGGQTNPVAPVARIDGGGAWSAAFEEVEIFSAAARRAWRSVSAICAGGAQPIIVPFRASPADIPFPAPGGTPLTGYPDIMHEGGAPFASGAGYQFGVVDATLSVAASLGATRLKIAIAYGGELQGGEHFSINHHGLRWRLYRIGKVKNNGDGTFNVTVTPPLRADSAAGIRLNFDTPKCVMRLASGNAMDAVFEKMYYSQPSPSFVEAFPPFPIPEE